MSCLFFLIFRKNGKTIWCRVFYPRGHPRLVKFYQPRIERYKLDEVVTSVTDPLCDNLLLNKPIDHPPPKVETP